MLKIYKLTFLLAIFLVSADVYSQVTPAQVRAKAVEYYLKGDFQNAIPLFDDYLGSYPQDAEALDYRGLSYLALKNYSRAIEDFSSAIRVNKSGSMNYVYRAAAFQAIRNFDGAKQDYKDALFYDVNNLEAYYGLNLLYLRLGELDQSLNVLEKPATIEPKAARPYFMKAITYIFMKDTSKIFENVAEGLSWDSTYFLKYTTRDLVYVKSENYRFAFDLFTQQIQMDPDSYLAYFNRGLINYMMGSYENAESDLKMSLKLNNKPTKLFTNTTNKLIRACYRVD